jgi:hypothetical protein
MPLKTLQSIDSGRQTYSLADIEQTILISRSVQAEHTFH